VALNLKGEVESEHFSPSPKSSSSHTSYFSSSSSEDEIKPHEGGLLMVRYKLGKVPKELDSSQRQNIFHTRCLVNNKLVPSS